jgi:hypothetical protein
MADAVLKTLTGTVSDDALSGPCQVWGIAVDGSLSTTAIIQLHDNISSTSTIIAQLQTNGVAGTGPSTFEKFTAMLFPRPVRFSSALSVTASAGVTRYWVYIGGI